MARNDVAQIKRVISWLGFNYPNGQWRVMVLVYITITSFLVVNSVQYLIHRWGQIDKRLDGIKGLVQYIIFLPYFLALSSDWKNSVLLTETIEAGLYQPSRTKTRKTDLERQIENDVTRLNTIWSYSLVGYVAMVISAPLAVFLFRLTQNGVEDITTDMLYTPIPFYFPKNLNNLAGYFLSFALQSYFTTYGIGNGYVAIVSAFNSMQLIEGELKLLRQSLEEMDNQPGSIEDDVNRDFLVNFVRRHYYVYRRVKEVTKGMQLVAFSINSGMSILVCIAVYKIATINDIIVTSQETIYGGILTFCLYCYGLMGEKVSIADENLRAALYAYMWVDQPQWFKRSLLIIMTRTTRTIEMKSFGLFSLNLRNFILAMRAAYSYYNVLSSLK